tara:strand:- start:149 stop:406 length:258 start_codon:yes stop_codon:yes gene_type:complete
MDGERSQERISGALRSVYRYKEMTEGNAPDILIEAESELLEKRFALLSAGEIFALVKLWPQYLAQQSAVEVIDNKQFEQYLMTVN